MPDQPPPPSWLPGAAWRPLALGDVAAYVRLLEAARRADGGEEVTTEESARRSLEDPGAPPETSTLALALPGGALAAALVIHPRAGGAGARRAFLWGVTDPAFRGRGVGSALLAWGVARAEEILRALPADLPGLVEAFVEDERADALALHKAAGFRAVRWYYDMRRDLREPLPAPPDLGGLELRPFDPAMAERVRLAHNESFADHWGSEPITDEAWRREFVGDPGFRPDLSFVVFDGDEVAAATLNYVLESDWEASGVREGWIGQLGVRRPWRRRGVATALLVRSMAAFRSAGLDGAILGVDTENTTGALGIYERAGFRAVRRTVRLQRPLAGDARP